MGSNDLVSEVTTEIYTAAIEAEIRHAFSLCNRARGETHKGEANTAMRHVAEARKSLDITQDYMRKIDNADVDDQRATLRQQLAELESRLRELEQAG